MSVAALRRPTPDAALLYLIAMRLNSFHKKILSIMLVLSMIFSPIQQAHAFLPLGVAFAVYGGDAAAGAASTLIMGGTSSAAWLAALIGTAFTMLSISDGYGNKIQIPLTSTIPILAPTASATVANTGIFYKYGTGFFGATGWQGVTPQAACDAFVQYYWGAGQYGVVSGTTCILGHGCTGTCSGEIVDLSYALCPVGYSAISIRLLNCCLNCQRTNGCIIGSVWRLLERFKRHRQDGRIVLIQGVFYAISGGVFARLSAC